MLPKKLLAADGGVREITSPFPHAPWPVLAPETVDAVERYLRDGLPLSISKAEGIIGSLEQELGDVLKLENVLTTSSGTSALHAAYIALDLPPGSEVVAPVSTFHASVSPALHCGLRPVLVDVEPDTGNLSADALKEAVTSRTACVVVNHTWGHPAEMDDISDVCRRGGIALIEDCSHAYLSMYRGRPVGTVGDIAVFSMQANKMLAAGEGGFLATHDRNLFERAILAGHYRGRSLTQIEDPSLGRFADTGLGLKHRLHPLVAVIAYHELQHLEERGKLRTSWLEQLDRELTSIAGVAPPARRPYVSIGAPFGYKPEYIAGELARNGREVDCDAYIDILTAEGLDIHRPSIRPLNEMPLFQGPPPMKSAAKTWRPQQASEFTGCAEYFRNRLSLPVFTAKDSGPIVGSYIRAMKKVAGALAGAVSG